MMTESDENQETGGEPKLTDRQFKFLPVLLANATYAEACRKGRVSRQTLYEWLRQPAFKAELDRQRDELVAQGFALLSQSVVKAVETLVELLDGGDRNVRRLAAVNILSQHLRFRELDDLARRIDAIEERLRSTA